MYAPISRCCAPCARIASPLRGDEKEAHGALQRLRPPPARTTLALVSNGPGRDEKYCGDPHHIFCDFRMSDKATEALNPPLVPPSVAPTGTPG